MLFPLPAFPGENRVVIMTFCDLPFGLLGVIERSGILSGG